jgi:metal-sulfur cluster biosynthetic enzyme
MGLIYGVDINDDIVNITMTLTSPGCPAAPQLLNGSQTVVQQLDGVEEVNVNSNIYNIIVDVHTIN